MNGYRHLYRLILPLLVVSFVTNLAVLISPLFMMQVLDRVIPSGNTATLLLLGVLALGALAVQSVVEGARDLCLGRVARWTERLGAAMALAPAHEAPQSTIDEVGKLSGFLTSPGAAAALNVPWIPLFLLALWLIHPSFVTLIAIMLALGCVARVIMQILVLPSEAAAQSIAEQEKAILHNAAAFADRTGVAMIAQNLRSRFQALQESRHGHLDGRQFALSAHSGLTGFVRSSGQILALGLGAYLTTQGALSAGGMIAASIILSKSYMTIEATVTQLPQIKGAYGSFKHLLGLGAPNVGVGTEVLDLSGHLRAEGLIVPRGGGAPPRLDRVTFAVEPGQCLAIVGPSGSGKSTLLTALAGISPAPIGAVFLDQSEVKSLTARNLFETTGFVPQLAALLPGTIAENIACFAAEAQDAQILDAAKMAGVHGLISALPNSYSTDIAREGHLISAGQSQRIALARAIFTKPKYLFLDEPNALLDADGERTLAQTIARLKVAGVTVVMVLHRSGIMGLADKILRLDHGRMVDFGTRSEVMGRLGAGNRFLDVPLLESSVQDLSDWVETQFTRSSDADFAVKSQMVASELFSLALAQRPDDEVRLIRFEFTFINDTTCELAMTEPEVTDAPEVLARIQEKISKDEPLEDGLTSQEASLVAVEKLSDRFEVTITEETTHFRVAMTGGVARKVQDNQAAMGALN